MQSTLPQLMAPFAPLGRQGGGGQGSAHSGEMHPGKLTNLIKQRGDVGQLQGLVEEHGGSFDHNHVSAAWVSTRPPTWSGRTGFLSHCGGEAWHAQRGGDHGMLGSPDVLDDLVVVHACRHPQGPSTPLPPHEKCQTFLKKIPQVTILSVSKVARLDRSVT